MNLIILIGRLGADPERRETTGGTVMAKLSVATDGGAKDAPPDWHRVVVWGAQAEACVRFLKKGSQVGIEGRMKYTTWEKDGVRRTSSEVNAHRVEFLSDGGSAQKKEESSRSNQRQEPNVSGSYEDDGDLPF